MSELVEIEHRKQEFLSNHAFLRVCEVFGVYQDMLAQQQGDADQMETIRERASLVFQNNDPSFDVIVKKVFVLCEEGVFSKEKFAELLAGSLVGDTLLQKWSQKPDQAVESQKVLLNEVVEYVLEEDGRTVYINIVPSSVRGKEVWVKVLEGLQLLAQKMNTDASLRSVNNVHAVSWLFGSSHFREKIAPFLGGGVRFEPEPPSADVTEIQRTALTYHKGTMQEYLTNGTLPQVLRMRVTKKDFLEKFLV